MKLDYRPEIDECVVNIEDKNFRWATITDNTLDKKRGDTITNLLTLNNGPIQSFVTIPEMSYLVTRIVNKNVRYWDVPIPILEIEIGRGGYYTGDKTIQLRYNTDNGWIFLNLLFTISKRTSGSRSKIRIKIVDGMNQDGQLLNEEETILAEDIANSIDDIHDEYLGIIFSHESPYRVMVAGKLLWWICTMNNIHVIITTCISSFNIVNASLKTIDS